MGSGLNSTFWQVGVATGIAVLGAVFQSQIRRSTLAALSATVTGRQVARSISVSLATELPSGSIRQASAGLAAGPRHALETAYRIGFATTLSHLMLIAAGIAAAGSLAAFSFIRQRDLAQPPGGLPAPASTANQAHLDARFSRPG
jgi:uncharacterized membrane protein AbrB (regulator of aidB expression)